MTSERNSRSESATSLSSRRKTLRFDGRRVARLVVALVTLAVGLFVVVPFVGNASETRGDAAGHLALARYLRDHLWPAMRGFDPCFFLGFLQGEFYPPLFHYLVATLGKLVPLEVAYRTVIALALLVTPCAAFRCARAFGMHPTRAAWFTVATVAILCTSPTLGGAERLPGGTFHSTVVIGLAANGFALPLWFECAGACALAFRRRGIRNALVAAVLAALVVISHFVCGVAAALLAAALTIAFLQRATLRRRSSLLLRVVGIAVTTFLLSAFFVVPFFVDRSVSPLANIPAGHVPLSDALAALSTLALGVRRVRRNRAAMGCALFVIAVVVMQVVGTRLELAAHLDRFHPFVQIAAVAVLAMAVPRGLTLGCSGALAGALACALAMAHRTELWEWRKPSGFIAPELPAGARTLIAADVFNLPGPHWLSNAWPSLTRSSSALGLFVESSPVAPYLFQLAKCLVPGAPSWGVDLGSGFEDFQSELLASRGTTVTARLQGALRRFGIDHLLSEQPLPEGLIPDPQASVDFGPTLLEGRFTLHRVVPSSAALVARATLVRGPLVPCADARSTEYARLARDWLFAPDDAAPLPFVGTLQDVMGAETSSASSSVAVEVVDEFAPHWRLRIASERAVPVVLALGFHPRLAASLDGHPLPLLRSGPGLCLLMGSGVIDIRLVSRRLESVCDGVSFAFWVIVSTFLVARVSGKERQVRFQELPKGRP